MLYEGPRCPRRRGEVIKAVLKLGSLRHDGVGRILHGGIQSFAVSGVLYLF